MTGCKPAVDGSRGIKFEGRFQQKYVGRGSVDMCLIVGILILTISCFWFAEGVFAECWTT